MRLPHNFRLLAISRRHSICVLSRLGISRSALLSGSADVFQEEKAPHAVDGVGKVYPYDGSDGTDSSDA